MSLVKFCYWVYRVYQPRSRALGSPEDRMKLIVKMISISIKFSLARSLAIRGCITGHNSTYLNIITDLAIFVEEAVLKLPQGTKSWYLVLFF